MVRKVGAAVQRMIFRRITQRGRTADGRPLPKLARGWFVTSPNDPRFKGKGLQYRNLRLGGPESASTLVLVDKQGYASAKRKIGGGGQNHRTGELTGRMWKSLTAQVQVKKDGAWLRLHFKGTDPATRRIIRDEHGKPELTPKGKPRRRSMRNRDKARLLQMKGGRQLFELMGLAGRELDAARDLVVDGIRRVV